MISRYSKQGRTWKAKTSHQLLPDRKSQGRTYIKCLILQFNSLLSIHELTRTSQGNFSIFTNFTCRGTFKFVETQHMENTTNHKSFNSVASQTKHGQALKCLCKHSKSKCVTFKNMFNFKPIRFVKPSNLKHVGTCEAFKRDIQSKRM